MAQEDDRIRLMHFWSEIYYKIISDFHSSQHDVIEEQPAPADRFEQPVFPSDPDLGVHCIKNRHILECERTLECISRKMNFVVSFTHLSSDRAFTIRQQILTQLFSMLAGFFGTKFKNPPEVYGSFDNGLCSDIDNINIYAEYENVNANEIWRQIYDRMEFNGRFTRISLDVTSPQPLLTLRHKATKIETVVSFSDHTRPMNSALMKAYLNLNPNLKPVILYLKHILTLNNLFGESKITSYHLFWLATFFFQRKQLLPTVKVLRAMTDVDELKITPDDRWDYTVPEPENAHNDDNPIEESADSLFLGFVGFYSNFDFLGYVICPYIGHAIPIHQFESYWVPKTQAEDPKPNLLDKPSFVKSAINFQDPIVLHRNSFHSVPIEIVNSFKFICRSLYLHYYCVIFSGYKGDVEFPVLFPAHTPICLIQSASFTLNASSLPQSYTVLNCMVLTIRLVMENCLKFTKVRIINNSEPRSGRWINVVYFHYTSHSDQCNIFTKLLLCRKIQSYVPGRLINFTPEYLQSTPLKISIVCEIYDRNSIVVLMEGTSRLTEFFNAYGCELFQYVLSHILL